MKIINQYRGDTLNHVLDVSNDGADASEMLTGTEPDGDLEGLLVNLLELNSDVLKVALKGSTGTGDLDSASLDLNGH